MTVSRDRRNSALIAVLLAAVTIAVYWRTASYPFLAFDDSKYLEPPQVRAGLSIKGVAWAFTHAHFANWHPLTTIAYMATVQCFGLDSAGPFHVLNVLLHAINGVVLFALLRRWTAATWRSALVATLFLLHPLHVESVAWVSELKDLLSALFFLLTIAAYTTYVYRGGHGRYALVLAMFVLGLLSKPMVVTLPFVLLLLDYWPLRRIGGATDATNESAAGSLPPPPPPVSIRRALLEKAPMIALSVISSVITIIAQRAQGAISSTQVVPIGFRFQNAIVSYVLYLWKTLWPRALAAMYPLIELPRANVLAAAALLIAITLVVVWQARRRGRRYLLVGWLWFIGMLLPVIGLVQVGNQAMADRYAYLPLIGVFVIVAWLAGEAASRSRPQLVAAAAMLAIAACTVRTARQIPYWHDDLALFTRALAVTRFNWFAGVNRADALFKANRTDDAIAQYHDVLQDFPDCAEAFQGLGVCYANQRKFDQAAEQFRSALSLKPDDANTHNSLGFTLLMLNDADGAAAHAAQAVQLAPDDADFRYNFALALIKQEKLDDAMPHLRESLRLRPTAEAHTTMADLLLRQGDVESARREATAALALDEHYAPAHGQLGMILLRQRKLDEADAAFRRAAELDSRDLESRFQRVTVLLGQGKLDAADAVVGELAAMSPDNARLFLQRGLLAQMRGDFATATRHYRRSIELDPKSSARNNLAWVLATARDASVRNGEQAVRLAESARADARGAPSPELLDTLAAAYAEAGDFPRAVTTAKLAQIAAVNGGRSRLEQEIGARLSLYEKGEAYRE